MLVPVTPRRCWRRLARVSRRSSCIAKRRRSVRPGDTGPRSHSFAKLPHRLDRDLRHVSANGARRNRLRARPDGDMKYTVTVNGTDIVVELDGENARAGDSSVRARLSDVDGG